MPSNDNKDIKFTGDPVAFDGVEGKRDPKTGKGRFDLIPTEVYYPLFSKADHDWILDCHPAAILMAIANEKFIEAIIKMTIYAYAKHNEDYAASSSEFWHGVWPMLQDLAIHFQKGAEHYGERNCQKGIPLWSFKDSAMRHATQVFEGKTDEPHAISVIWNCWMAQWTVMQEKEKEGERRLLALERAAESRVNSALGDNLKDAVTNLREVRKKLKTERHNCTNDVAKYDVLSQSIEGLKNVINMLYSIAETDAAPRCDQGEYIMTPDGELPVSHLGEEWKPTKQPVDVHIRSDHEIPQDQREKLKADLTVIIKSLKDSRKDLMLQEYKYMSDSMEYVNIHQSVADLKRIIKGLQCVVDHVNIPIVTAVQKPAWQDAYNKIIAEMALNAKETGIPWPPKEPEIIPDDHLPVSHLGEEWKPTKQPVDVIIHYDHEIPQKQRDKLKKFCMQMYDQLTKLNFEFSDGKDKWDKLIDVMAENAKEAGIPWPPKKSEIDVIQFPKSWSQTKELESERTVDTVAIQRMIRQLKEEFKKAHGIFADANGKGTQVFFNHLRPVMNDMIAVWNSITPLLLDEKTPEQ